MFMMMLLALFGFIVGVPLLFKGFVVRRASIFLSFASLIFLLVVNSLRLPYFGLENMTGARVASAFMISIVTLASIYVFYDLYSKLAFLTKSNSRKSIIICTTTFFLFWYTYVLLYQFRIGFGSIILSIGYILVSLACLALGLWLRSKRTRRFAIVLVFISMGKLLIIDMLALRLDTIYIVISSFVFGVALIGMSLLYRFFYKKFEKNDSSYSSVPVLQDKEMTDDKRIDVSIGNIVEKVVVSDTSNANKRKERKKKE